MFGQEAMQNARVNNKTIKCLRDTGSSISLIKKNLLPDLKLLPEFTVCTTAFNSKHTIPMALVELATKEGSGLMKVGVVDNLLFDFILGNDIKKLESNTLDFNAAITRSRAKQALLEQECKENIQSTPENLAKVKPFLPNKLKTIVEVVEPPQPPLNTLNTELVEKDENDELFKFESLKGSSKQEFINEQQQCPSLARVRKIIGTINTNVHPGRTNATHFYVRNNLIYRKFYFGKISKVGQESSLKQLVVPLKYRRSILSVAHDFPLAAHIGVNKTKHNLLSRFYWPGLHRDVLQYCNSCDKCQKICKTVKKSKVPMVIMPTATRPWEKIIFDIVGPLEKSKKGNMYILVVIDVHSHYPEAFPLKSIDSKTIANELIKLFTKVGIPMVVQHDQATNFLSKIMTQIYSLLGIKDIKSSCYRPETNALVERLNGSIKKLLKVCLVDRDIRCWDEVLPLVLFSLRASKHETTGFSPFELMYGYQIRGPLDILRELWVDECQEQERVDLHQYVLDLRTTMRELSRVAVEREELTKGKVKERFDQTANMVEFQEGEKVFVLLPQKVNSLTSSWAGPYVVLKKLGVVSYLILLHDRTKKTRVVHTNMLRKYTPRISCFVSTNELEEFESKELASFPDSVRRTATSNDVTINPKLTLNQTLQLKNLLTKYDQIFSDLPGSTDVLRHQIRTINDTPVNKAPYTVPQALIPVAQRELDIALQLGIISPVVNETNPTAYASPTMLVKKKDGNKFRMVIDYRELNSLTIPQRYRIPNASHLINKVAKAKFLSLTDLTRGYNQLRICAEDIHKTGFLCLGKHFVCNYLSFGLCGGPSTFQLLMDTVLMGMEEFALSFIDDIIIFSESFEDHLIHLETVFEALRRANLTAQPSKVSLAMSELKFLGHLVGNGKKCVDLEKLNVLDKIKVPTTKREVRSFLGFIILSLTRFRTRPPL
jgi:hypothetical protein